MRKFFDNWRDSLKWQRLKPFEKFAAVVERNWEGLAAYCGLEDKPSLGFVEGLNNKIRVIQRRAYSLRDVGIPQAEDPDIDALKPIIQRNLPTRRREELFYLVQQFYLNQH